MLRRVAAAPRHRSSLRRSSLIGLTRGSGVFFGSLVGTNGSLRPARKGLPTPLVVEPELRARHRRPDHLLERLLTGLGTGRQVLGHERRFMGRRRADVDAKE